MNSSTKVILVVLALAVLVSAGLWWWSNSANTIEVENNGLLETPPLNTEDETPPGIPTGWVQSSTPAGDLYAPVAINSAYVATTDWPPSLSLEDAAYACTEAGEESDRAGGTEEVTVNGRTYCRTVVAEGAAGSLYRQYAYAFPHEDQSAILTFSVRFPQCENYEEAEAQVCEAEQSGFDPDDLADRVIGTIIWN